MLCRSLSVRQVDFKGVGVPGLFRIPDATAAEHFQSACPDPWCRDRCLLPREAAPALTDWTVSYLQLLAVWLSGCPPGCLTRTRSLTARRH